MEKIVITLAALIFTVGTVQAASFRSQAETLPVVLAAWHVEPTAALSASYSFASLSEVVDAYWRALRNLGYRGNLEAVDGDSTTYFFEGEAGTLLATFSLTGDQVQAVLKAETVKA